MTDNDEMKQWKGFDYNDWVRHYAEHGVAYIYLGTMPAEPLSLIMACIKREGKTQDEFLMDVDERHWLVWEKANSLECSYKMAEYLLDLETALADLTK